MEVSVCPEPGSAPLLVPYSVGKRTGALRPNRLGERSKTKQAALSCALASLIVGDSDFCYTFAQWGTSLLVGLGMSFLLPSVYIRVSQQHNY